MLMLCRRRFDEVARNVAQIFNLLYRGFATRSSRIGIEDVALERLRRLQIGDTAGCKPALHSVDTPSRFHNHAVSTDHTDGLWNYRAWSSAERRIEFHFLGEERTILGGTGSTVVAFWPPPSTNIAT